MEPEIYFLSGLRNAQPSFSPLITRGMFVQLASRYPHAQNIGAFQLRWRE